MKKTVIIIFTIIVLVYLSLPFIGVNVSFSELIGRPISKIDNKELKHLSTPPGLNIKIHAKNLDHPRFMLVTDKNNLIVSEPFQGKVYLIPYNKPQERILLASDLKKPTSMDIFNGYLYIAEENAIGKIKFDAEKQRTSGQYQRIINNLPSGKGHWTRTIKFSPEGVGFVSIGSSCNVCIEKNKFRATISRFIPGENKLSIYATGLRNSVGFDWSPKDGLMYATDNGRDWLGDNFPPDELNIIKKGAFYGWPYANGDKVADPSYGKGHQAQIERSISPIYGFQAHQAPLGITFIKNPKSKYYGKAFIALHGSWNRSKKIGYKVIMLSFDKDKIEETDFISGFLNNEKVLGRPVHLVEGKHNEFYLSDDFNGVIYKIY